MSLCTTPNGLHQMVCVETGYRCQVCSEWQPYTRSTNSSSTPVSTAQWTPTTQQAVKEALIMLSKRQIATWYADPRTATSGIPKGNGYYAGWDDAEYAVKQALELIRQEEEK
jgi:hypothetical protein